MYTQDVSATDLTALVLRSTSIALSSTSIVSAKESSIPIEKTMQFKHAQKIYKQGNDKDRSLVSLGWKETKLLKKT
jgi:hypothetical protein